MNAEEYSRMEARRKVAELNHDFQLSAMGATEIKSDNDTRTLIQALATARKVPFSQAASEAMRVGAQLILAQLRE